MEATSKQTIWLGRTLSGLVAAFLALDAVMKLVLVTPVVEATERLGYPIATARPLGLVLLASTILSLVPRTQVIGALLVTAYLGGATATHVRVGDPFWFPIAMGVLLWAGLVLRTPRLRALISARSAA
jgi:DoxX-like protein